MKLLDKRKIDTALATQRKSEIDNGVKLAVAVDDLRRARVEEEKSLRDYRDRAFKEIQIEIDSLLEDKANLLKWNTETRAERLELLKPLDEEWQKLNHEKEQFEKEKDTASKREEAVTEREKAVKVELEKVSRLVSELDTSKTKIEKIQKEAVVLRDLAQKEYELAKHEHDGQTENHEKGMLEIDQRKIEYEIAQKTLEIEIKLVKEKESELISREQHLETQLRTLQIARGIINNGTSQSDNTKR